MLPRTIHCESNLHHACLASTPSRLQSFIKRASHLVKRILLLLYSIVPQCHPLPKTPASSGIIVQSTSSPEVMPLDHHPGSFPVSPIPNSKLAVTATESTTSESSEPVCKRLKYKVLLHLKSLQLLIVSSFADKAVTVITGPEKFSFVVHKRLLYDASPLIATTLSRNSKEGNEKQVTLPNVEPTIF